VIEVDIVSLNGLLYAGHDAPFDWIGGTVFRGPPLAQIWIASAGAEVIKLDLKESSPAFNEMVLDFLADREGQRLVIIVSSQPEVIRLFAERAPSVLRFYSVGSERRLDTVRGDLEFAALLDGVSIRESLIDGEVASWFEDHDLLMLAWTVNDMARINELVELGIDGITTDNLAIMRLLGGRYREEFPLRQLRLSQPPVEASPVPGADDGAAAMVAGGVRSARRGTRRSRNRAAPTRAGYPPSRRSAAVRRGSSSRPPGPP
jgi:hypothetical protein